jgi:hypothetical protein
MIDRWTELEQIPAAMADAVKPHLAATTLEGYQRYLSAMVHYTRGSGERLRHAKARATDPDLAAFFDRMAREEAGHYRLAEADLAAFGLTTAGDTPDDVVAFHRAWMENESDDPATWLGALYPLESVGGHLGADAAKNLARLGLGRDQVRFVMVHLEADTEHGAATAEHARRYLEASGERLLASARSAAAFWIGLHVRAFTGAVSP